METVIGQGRGNGRAVAAILVAALWLRALVPGGFMPMPSPVADSVYTLGLCRGILTDKGQSGTAGKQAGLCLFMAMASLAPPGPPVVVLPSIVLSTPLSFFFVPAAPLRPQRWVPEARAPPLGA